MEILDYQGLEYYDELLKDLLKEQSDDIKNRIPHYTVGAKLILFPEDGRPTEVSLMGSDASASGDSSNYGGSYYSGASATALIDDIIGTIEEEE